MGLTALASSTRRDALATRAASRRRALEPLAERAEGRATREADIEPPAGMPRYLELGPGERGLPPPRTSAPASVSGSASGHGEHSVATGVEAHAAPVHGAPSEVPEASPDRREELAHEAPHEREDADTEALASEVAVVDAPETATGAGEAAVHTAAGAREPVVDDAHVAPALTELLSGDPTAMAALDDTALIDEELAEHERWAGSFGALGTSGSDERARFLLDQAGEGASAGFWGGVGMGAVMGAAGGALGHIAGRRLATLAVSRGATAVPVPGLGPAIGGVMAIAGLFTRDWGASFDTIGRVGTGEGYEGLANDLEGIAEALDMACTFMDIVGGICGAIAVGMWVGAVVSGGALAPLALTLSAIGTGISIATTAVGVIINVAVRPAVTALRALHAFEAQGDPATVEAAGASLSSAAAQLTGAAGGALGGRAGGHIGTRGGAGLYRAGRAVAARRTGGRPAMSASAGPGPRVHVEMPEAPGGAVAVRPDAPTATARPAAVDGPAASAPGRPRSGGARPMDTRIHNAELRALRDRAERHLGVELTPDQVRSLAIREAHGESAVGRPDPGLNRLRGPDPPPRASRGDARAWSHPDADAQARIESSLRREASAEFTGDTRNALRDEGLHNAATLESTGHLSPNQRETVLETPVSSSERRALRSEGDVVPGALPDDWQFHHRMSVRDYPEHAARSRAGLAVPRNVHEFEEHGGSYRPEVELLGPRDPGALSRAGFGPVREAVPGARRRHVEVAEGFASTGHVSADIRIEYRRSRARAERRLARLRAAHADAPTEVRARTIARLEAEVRAATDLIDSLPGPAASSPRRTSPDAASPTGTPPRYAPHTETVRTTDRAAAMAQYHDQIRTDPSRESGVWRGPDGTFYVMQGDSGSVRPPSAAGPLSLVYHSHPVEADAAGRGLVSQPSQADGDIGVLAFEHGEGPAGRRVESELHFPTYGPDGTHSGFGATRFAYDPTSPLPLQVTTTLPGGRPATQRYASYADFEARTGIRAGGDTPEASTAARLDADAVLTADRAAAARRIDETAAGLAGRTTPVGARVGRDEARTAAEAESSSDAGERGPAYAVSVAGLAPGESMELSINPAYPAPPGTPQELDALLDQVDTASRTAEALSGTEAEMAAHAETEREHAAGLEEATAVGEELVAEREAHISEVDATSGTNDSMLTQAGEAWDSLGESSREASALGSLVVSLDAFRGMANLFSYLPGDLGTRAETARNDSARLIKTLNRVSDADAARAAVGTGRETIEGNGERIEAVSHEGVGTDAEIADGTSALTELGAANAASLAETEATHGLATRERRAAEDSEAEAQGAHDALLAELQGWAAQHRQAREDAVSQALGNYEAMGLSARELPS